MVKRSIDQKLGLRNFDAGNERSETEAVVKSRKGLSGVEGRRAFKWHINGKQKSSYREETSVVSGTTVVSVQNRHRKPLHPLSHQHEEVEVHRGQRTSEAGVRFGKTKRQPCKNFWKRYLHLDLPCDYSHPPECQFF